MCHPSASLRRATMLLVLLACSLHASRVLAQDSITRVTNTASVASGSTDPRLTNNAASVQTRVVNLLNR